MTDKAPRPLATIIAASLAASACAKGSPPPDDAVGPKPDLVETALKVPGFADFLAVDGDAVWVTNDGRVEKWSPAGKLAETPVPRPCGTMAIAAGSLWVANCKGGEVWRINLATAQVEAKIATGLANPKGETNVVAGADAVWVPSDAAGKVARIDPATNAVTATVTVAPETWYLAYGFDALWAVSSEGKLLQKIDPASTAVTDTTALGDTPGFLAAGEGAVWVQEQGDGTVAKVDPAALTVLGRIKVGDNLKWGDIDAAGGAVWLRTTDDQTMVVIDPARLTIRARMGAAVGSGALRWTPKGVWTSAHDNQTLSWWSAPAAPPTPAP
ncbi:Vgb family protein [Erythrobacter sp. BLCC-B19]|uniref:Vgb family protein n=1 Tax=Erythrobacter sp. BLCC-B19 TaxID=3025315 RepID=UPI0023604511|nr:YncE family protein [Erythrobacter sp. BLCC-B19]WDA41251.1 YncE family protein [Erythrobacter sp. BLCC-B19]